ncbi:MAG: hypothetical protein ACREUG_07710 [Steroidobacteraceae bacterium]
MADNLGTSNGEQVRNETQKAREHVKAAGSAAADALRDNASTLRDNAAAAAEAARSGARGASDWARSRFEDLQGRVEERPQTAALWALGIGVVTGFLLGTILRGGRD